MSYSIYGSIQFRSIPDKSDQMRAEELANAIGLIVQVGDDINDFSVIAEVTKEQGDAGELFVPYYILDKIGSESSQDLISPSIEGDWRLARARIEGNLTKIGLWLDQLLSKLEASRVSLYVSEDYENSFITLRVTPGSFSASCMEIIDRQKVKVGIPSIKATVQHVRKQQ